MSHRTMARNKPAAVKPKPKPTQTTDKSAKPRLSNAERSAYFARREAAKVLRTVLQGDANRQAVASIKSLVYSPSIRNKKATFALVCQTLKHLRIIKDVFEIEKILNSKWKRQEELIYIIAYDILFGKEISLVGGDAEKFFTCRKDAMQSALAKLVVRKKVKNIDDLIALYQPPDITRPCYVRVNTLKLDVDSALHEFGKQFKVQKDGMIPHLLMLPPHTDLHNHSLVLNGSIFVQGKASSMVAAVLDPKPGWEVLDACSAPGNKTVHLAALMKGKGKIIACELNKDRAKRLEDTIRLSGATNIEVMHGDFLKIDPKGPFSKVSAILLDPSCSGSGTASQRLDHLLPSHTTDVVDTERLNKLAAFQKKALAHALSFPAVERIVYSTCSINQIENEDVVNSVLPLATSNGFQLATPFPQWQRRGLPVFEGSEHLLRTDPVKDKEGFFIALFVKKGSVKNPEERSGSGKLAGSLSNDEGRLKRSCHANKKKLRCLYSTRHFQTMVA
ncbi:28S rRNA (cytosine-C(5))-methyltransferase [Salix suchowensis]|nr:28S rRNA (cytosine-C(5))-methyltransferase [Salix suchowensis]